MAKTCTKCQAVYADEFDRCPGCRADGAPRDYGAKPVIEPGDEPFDAINGAGLLSLLCIGLCATIGWLIAGSIGALGGVAIGMLLGSPGVA